MSQMCHISPCRRFETSFTELKFSHIRRQNAWVRQSNHRTRTRTTHRLQLPRKPAAIAEAHWNEPVTSSKTVQGHREYDALRRKHFGALSLPSDTPSWDSSQMYAVLTEPTIVHLEDRSGGRSKLGSRFSIWLE